MKIKGMDVSSYQGKISVANFKKAKDYGIEFVILKLGYTGYSNYTCKEESVFRNNYKNAKAAGLPVGIYYYSLANSKSEAKREADFTVKQLKGLEIDYPVYIDMEDSKYRQHKCSKATLASVCNEWCKVIAAAGYTPGVYASTSWFNNKIGTIAATHTKWVAQYYKTCQYKGTYDIWQYSSTEGVPGISSKTDVNWCYKDFLKKKTTAEPKKTESITTKEYKLVGYTGTFPKLPVRGYFKRGDNSKQVKYLQLFLNWYGDYNLVVDTVIGSKTIRAIERFQKNQGLAVDGLFGKKCLAKAKAYKKKIEIEKPIISEPVPEPAPIVLTETSYQKDFPSLSFVKTKQEVIDDTIAWAKMIAADNRFHYGYTNKHGSTNNKKWSPNAHHNGCYFCGTNTTSGDRSKKGITDYQYTYCCNPFVGAAWAHGGGVPKALELCKKGSSWGFKKGAGYDSSKLFDNLGHPKMANLQVGDVLCRNTHVALYAGDGKIVEAGGGDDNVRNSTKWNNSIRVRTLSKTNYANFPRVHRYNQSQTKIAKPIEYGDVNKEVKKLQEFLNWYGDYKLVEDGKFMEKTLAAVKDFQIKESLTVDGIFGAKSLEKAKTIIK